MFEQAAAPASPGFEYVPPPPPAPIAAYELRPLSTGEILDRTFALYRQRFWLYCGLSAMAAAVGTLTQLAQMIWLKTPQPVQGGAQAAPTMAAVKGMLIGAGVTLAVALLHFIAYSVTQAATVSAVSSVYLGHETSMGIAFKAVRGRWWRYAGIAFWQIWSASWIFTLLFIPALILVAMKVTGLVVIGGFLILLAFLSMIYGVIAYLRNSLGIAASVFERLPVRAAMRRSKVLAAGMKGRIFLLLVMLYVLTLVAAGLQVPFAIFALKTHAGQRILAQGGSLLVSFLTTSLIGPLGAIAFCLFYFDARVRKEGFDIEALMDRRIGSPLGPVQTTEEVLLPSGFAPSGFTAPEVTVSSSPFAPSGFTAPIKPETAGPEAERG